MVCGEPILQETGDYSILYKRSLRNIKYTHVIALLKLGERSVIVTTNALLTVIVRVEVFHYTVGEHSRSTEFNEIALTWQTCLDNAVTSYFI